jgi:hypothetical protein
MYWGPLLHSREASTLSHPRVIDLLFEQSGLLGESIVCPKEGNFRYGEKYNGFQSTGMA